MSKKIKEELSKMKTEDLKNMFNEILKERDDEITEEGKQNLLKSISKSFEGNLEKDEYCIVISGTEKGEEVYVDFENVDMEDEKFMEIIMRLVFSSIEELPTKEEHILAWSAQMSTLLFNKLIGGLLHGNSTSK